MKFEKEENKEEVRLNLSPMIDVTFLLIIYFIVSMQMEPSLDNIIKLPPVANASKQEDALLQIYVLPAKILAGGRIHPDSTGLVAFSDKAKTPQYCPRCSTALLDGNAMYIPGRLLDKDKEPITDLRSIMAGAYGEQSRPPSFTCATCGEEIGPYLRLDEIPGVIREKKKEVLKLMVRQRNARRENHGLAPLSESQIDSLEKEVPLMIKADEKAFYGRILQVVNMAKDTAADIRSFAFVTLPEASKEVIMKQEGEGGGQ